MLDIVRPVQLLIAAPFDRIMVWQHLKFKFRIVSLNLGSLSNKFSHLMDLVTKSAMDANIRQQRNSIDPLDMILSYLDLHRIQSLSKINRQMFTTGP